MSRRLAVPSLLVLVCGALAYGALAYGAPGSADGHPTAQRAHPSVQQVHPSAAAPKADAPRDAGERPGAGSDVAELSYLAIGGGATPQSTEVSLEQNLALAEQVLHGPHVLLFAGGTDSLSVRVADDQAPSDPLLLSLGELFSPHADHHSRYRAPQLRAAAASLEAVEKQLVSALSHGARPLLVYVSAHGQQGEQARDNSVVLWGGRGLSAARLAELHDAHPRPLRFVSASCYSGGFAELAFRGADPKLGAARAPRCGLFAGTADRETSGCDPNPDRRQQEGYSIHLLQALRGRDRDGAVLPLAQLDLDGDGKVSLLEAHARASIAGRSIDVPTTTSERFLRSVESKPAAGFDAALSPELAALLKQLGARLQQPSLAAAKARWEAVDQQLRALDARLDKADAEVQDRFGELSARLLARWPMLDDPYHPEFAATLARDRKAIREALEAWPEAQRHNEAQRALDELDTQSQQLEVEEAQLARLLRAYETLGLASTLRRRGGASWKQYQALVACERFVPQ